MKTHLFLPFMFWMACVFLPVCAEEFKPGDREPTPQETLILELINRFRADPKAEAALLAPPGKEAATNPGGAVDWKMFVDEMNALKAAPPLVFNLDLLDAARRHSNYMIQNDMTHVEDPAKPGFYGVNFGDRCTKSGYKGFASGENAFRDPPNIKASHSGFVVDNGEGPGGMQPTRGHRTNMMNAEYREVGCSAVPHGKSFTVTHDFGIRKTRLVGGVVFTDRNSDSFYDVGEGLGGVTIKSSDGASTMTWKSGAFALDLKGEGSVTITAEYLGQSFSQKFDAGKNNIKFDWRVPEKLALERADQLLAAVEKVKDPKSIPYQNAILSLYLGLHGVELDAERTKRIESLTATAGPELETHQNAVLDALKNYDKTFAKTLEEHRKHYRGTVVEAWFQQAEMVANAKYSAMVLDVQRDENPRTFPANRKALITQIESLEKQITYPVFKQEIAELLANLRPEMSAKKGKG